MCKQTKKLGHLKLIIILSEKIWLNQLILAMIFFKQIGNVNNYNCYHDFKPNQ